jgi:hypothetical protein
LRVRISRISSRDHLVVCGQCWRLHRLQLVFYFSQKTDSVSVGNTNRVMVCGAMVKFLRIRLKRGWFSVGVQMTIWCEKLMGSSALLGPFALSTLATWQLRPCGQCLCFILQVTFIINCESELIGITVPLPLNCVFLEVIRSNFYKFTDVSEERAASLSYMTSSPQKMEGKTLLPNASQFVRDYVVSHPRRHSKNFTY